MPEKKITLTDIFEKKQASRKIVMLTAYDYPTAVILDKSEVDIVLVGDSLANVVLGLESTKDISISEMINHCCAVRKGIKNAFLVGDMPYISYQNDINNAVDNAKRFIYEAGCDAVKLEWFDQCLEVAEKIIKEGIPVMGHIGLTPQTAEKLGGFKVQGKDAESAAKIIKNATALDELGCFSIVLECVPSPIAKIITEKINAATIGIGAGPYCDGQVLVINDVLGLVSKFRPKFVKQYINLNDEILHAVEKFCEDVKTTKFPDKEHSYSMDEKEFEVLKTKFI